jgi:hypothetical protein
MMTCGLAQPLHLCQHRPINAIYDREILRKLQKLTLLSSSYATAFDLLNLKSKDFEIK